MRTPVLIALWGFALIGAISARAQNAQDVCASCHDVGAKLKASVHAGVGCASCHPKHEEYPHPPGVPKPACSQCHTTIAPEYARSVHGQAVKRGNSAAPDCAVCHGSAHEAKKATSGEFRKGVADTCGMCHTEIAEQFKASVHGKAALEGNVQAPVCTSCHGEHSILSPKSAASTVNAVHIRETCGQCHGNVRLSRKFGLPADRVLSFDASFHGLASKTGAQSVANCASCHGFHDILPSSNPKSSTNPKNLPQTCGQCHPGAGKRFAIGPVHQVDGGRNENAVRMWVRFAYSIIIPLTIGYMLLHNLGDFLRKLIARRFRVAQRRPRPAAGAAVREVVMYGFERVQHALTALSFLTLVWTGFALKYPDQVWARPLVAFEHSWPVRGTLHRAAAIVMIGASVLHVASLLFSRRLRSHWKEMFPRRQDVVEMILNLGYNMGLVSRKPRLSHHNYIAKMEYWALVWGTVVMVVTGVVLWANNWSLRFLPLWSIDAATAVHFYEAVLATLAILVWHFYAVIFDPDVYPLETAFLTGVSVKDEESGETIPAGSAEILIERTK